MVRLNSRTARAVAAGGLALILAWGGVVTAQAETLNAARAAVAVPAANGAAQVVGTDDTVKGTYDTVQAAINAAQAGETVKILKDTDESFSFDKKLTLTSTDPENPVTLTGKVNLPYSNGASGSTIENLNFTYGAGRWFSVEIHASNVTVRNCSFTIPDNVNSGSIAIWVQQYGQVGTKIEDNTFTFDTSDFRRAVEVYGEETTDITGTKSVTVSNNTCVTTKENSDAWLLDVQGWNYGVANVQVSGNKQGAGSNAVNGVRFANVSELSVTGNGLSGTMAESVASEKVTNPTDTPKSSSITITDNTTSAIKLDSAYLGDVATVARNKTAEGGASPVSGMEASVGDKAYPTFKEAIDAAQAGDTVTLLSDVKLPAATQSGTYSFVAIKKRITLDGANHTLNGQLCLENGSSGSVIKNVNFVMDKDTEVSNNASIIWIVDASNVQVTNNTFTFSKDCKSVAGKAVGVMVYPSAGKVCSGTVISGNTFTGDGAGTSKFAIQLSNEVNFQKDTIGVTNTVIENNTLTCPEGATQAPTFLVMFDKYDAAKVDPKTGVTGVTVTGNHLLEGSSGITSGLLVQLWGGTKDVSFSDNVFGGGNCGIYSIVHDNWGGASAKQDNIDIKNNTFNSTYAVVSNGDSIEANGLKFDTYAGTENDNTFGKGTIRYIGTGGTSSFYTYGVYYYDGDTLSGWETVSSENSFKPADPDAKLGYDFDGWFVDPQFSKAFDPKDYTDKIIGKLDLYAKWTAKTYSVTYDLGGGALPQGASNPGSYTVESDDFALASPVRDGYDFLGWFDANGKQVTSIAKGSTGDIELTAKWQAKTVPPAAKTWNVTFDDNIASTQNSVVKVEDGKTVARPADPTLDGWKFVGWFTDKALTAAYDFSTPVTGDLTLYGGWVKAGAAENAKPTAPKASDTPTTSGANKALPQTGDANSIVAPVALGVAGVAAVAGAVVMRRRQQ